VVAGFAALKNGRLSFPRRLREREKGKRAISPPEIADLLS
jgi:hypothetical protein